MFVAMHVVTSQANCPITLQRIAFECLQAALCVGVENHGWIPAASLVVAV